MNNNLKRLLEPGTRLFFIFLVIFAVSTFFFSRELALAEGIIIVLMLISTCSFSQFNVASLTS